MLDINFWSCAQDGAVREHGTHSELLSMRGHYYRLVEAQKSSADDSGWVESAWFEFSREVHVIFRHLQLTVFTSHRGSDYTFRTCPLLVLRQYLSAFRILFLWAIASCMLDIYWHLWGLCHYMLQDNNNESTSHLLTYCVYATEMSWKIL
jgi:hypothetical protein